MHKALYNRAPDPPETQTGATSPEPSSRPSPRSPQNPAADSEETTPGEPHMANPTLPPPAPRAPPRACSKAVGEMNLSEGARARAARGAARGLQLLPVQFILSTLSIGIVGVFRVIVCALCVSYEALPGVGTSSSKAPLRPFFPRTFVCVCELGVEMKTLPVNSPRCRRSLAPRSTRREVSTRGAARCSAWVFGGGPPLWRQCCCNRQSRPRSPPSSRRSPSLLAR